jgi:recombinational DNA repair ATPase RecF
MLSQGEKVTVGLLAVMSALQALHAAPLLVLDDFLGTLDHRYAAEVLGRARDVGCQYLVSTCQNRHELTTGADAVWVTTPRKDGVEYALPVKVQTAVVAE